MLVEKDTARRYWFDAESDITPTDLNTPTWTKSTSDLSQTTDYLQWANMTGGTENGYYDIGSGNVSDTKWVLRATLTVSSYSTGTAAHSRWCGLGLSSSSATLTGSQDSINIILRTNTSSDTIAGTRSNGTAVDSQLGTAGISGVTLGNGTFYLEMIRESDSDYKLYVRSGSHTGTLLGTGIYTNASGVTGLQYIKTDRLYSSVANGNFVAKWEDIEFYNNTTSITTSATWKQLLSGIGVFPVSTSTTDNIDYIFIETLGNAVDFGDLTTNRVNPLGASNTTRGIFSGGNDGSYSNTMDYITLSTTGNATDFGDLTVARGSGGDGVSSETRAVFAGGQYPRRDTIDYVTIDTPSNATSFGSLTNSRGDCGGVDDDVRGVFAGGYYSGAVNTIDYITIATPSNATSFGSLPSAEYGVGNGMSNKTRGVFPSGYNGSTKAMSYITISTTGNATTFGNMVFNGEYTAGASSSTRGILAGGTNRDVGGGNTKIIQYITIATTGNATTFGDLTTATSASTGVSDF